MTKELRLPMRARIRGMVFILLLLLALTEAHSEIIEVRDMEIEERVGEMTITLRFTEAVNYRSFTLRNPPRLILDIPGVALKEPRTREVRNEVVETISYRQHGPDTLRIVVNLAQPAESRVRKVGNKLLLSLSLPPEVKARLLTEERAKVRAEREAKERLAAREKEEGERRRAEEKANQLLERRAKREIELKVKERKGKLETDLSQGEKHYRANRFHEAIREFEAVLTLEPENEEARNYLTRAKEGEETLLLAKARAAREEKEREEEERKRQEIRHREEERKKRIAEHLSQGRGYYLQGRYAEAISEAEKVLALSPDNRPAEDLIIQVQRGILERKERRAREEREIVERRKILDVSRAPFTSPADYLGTLAPERDRDALAPGLKDDPEENVDATLRRRAREIMVTMDFRATDIREVLLHLARLSEITIAIDERALEGLAEPDVTIFTPSPISLTDALDIILKVKGLGYAIKEHHIWVAEAGREEEAVTRIFPLRHGIRRLREVAPLELEDEDGDDQDRDRGRDRDRRRR